MNTSRRKPLLGGAAEVTGGGALERRVAPRAPSGARRQDSLAGGGWCPTRGSRLGISKGAENSVLRVVVDSCSDKVLHSKPADD